MCRRCSRDLPSNNRQQTLFLFSGQFSTMSPNGERSYRFGNSQFLREHIFFWGRASLRSTVLTLRHTRDTRRWENEQDNTHAGESSNYTYQYISLWANAYGYCSSLRTFFLTVDKSYFSTSNCNPDRRLGFLSKKYVGGDVSAGLTILSTGTRSGGKLSQQKKEKYLRKNDHIS